jgi:hypothetical protein
MKRTILKVIAGLVLVAVILDHNPRPLESASRDWMNSNPAPPRRDFYFAKRQWLADARTIEAGIYYLYESGSDSPTSPMNVASIPSLLLMQHELATNIDGTETNREANRLTTRQRLLSSYGLAPSALFRDMPMLFR